MSSVYNIEHNKFAPSHLAATATGRTNQEDAEADLVGLFLLTQVLKDAMESPKEQQTAQANETASSEPNQGPSNAQMQQAYGALMELLAQLQATLAKYSNKNAQNNGAIATALIDEMKAACANQLKEIKKAAKEDSNATWWSTFAKWMEGILGGLTFLASLLGGQPQLAVIVLTLTVLSLTQGTQKITQWVADLISKDLIARNPGMSKEDADKISKVIADILMVVVVVAITAASAGAGSASAITNAAEGASNLESSLGARLLNFIQENNPFAQLSMRANYALIGGSQAIASTNFFGDIIAAACMRMKEGSEKEILQTVLGVILGLLTALAGAGASAAACLGSQAETSLSSFFKGIKDLKLSAALNVLMGTEMLGGTLESAGQIASGGINIELGRTLNEKGQFQALLTMLQALLNLNNHQAANNARLSAADMKSSGAAIAKLSADLAKMQEALARELQP